MAKSAFLSHLTKNEVRELFIGRLLDNSTHVVLKITREDDIDRGDPKTVRMIVSNIMTENHAYEEVILATTSKDLDTVEEILSALGYDSNDYITAKELYQSLLGV